MRNAMRSMMLALTLLSSAANSQSNIEPAMLSSQTEAPLLSGLQDGNRLRSSAMATGGSDMERTMMRMADMCEQMMTRSLAVLPYALAVGIALGILLTLALVLLIVLEVQWIMLWRRRLKAQL